MRRRPTQQPNAPVDRRAQRPLALGQVRGAPREQREGLPEPVEAVPSTPSTRMRAAASSIASGSPSSARGDPCDARGVLLGEREFRHRLASPLDVELRTEPAIEIPRSAARRRPARSSGGTRYSRSSAHMERAAARREHAAAAATASSSAASSTRTTPGDARGCPARAEPGLRSEQLGRSPRPAARSARSSTPSVAAIVWSTRSGSVTGARSTNGAPPSVAAAARASVVLPVPPGPVSVTSRVSSRPKERRRPPPARWRARRAPAAGTGPAVGSGTLAGRASGRARGCAARARGDPATARARARRAPRARRGRRRARLPAGRRGRGRGSAGRGAARGADVRRRAPRARPRGRRAALRPDPRSIRRLEGGEPRSSSRAASRRANGSYARSASAGPAPERERLSERPPPIRPARGARSARRRARAGSMRTRYPGACVTIRSAPNALRSAWTWTWSAFCALAGGDSPQIAVDQPVGRDRHVGLQQEQRKQRARPRAAEGDGQSVVADHLQRPQQPELHPLRPLSRFLSRASSGS